MTAIRLSDGRLFTWSPLQLTDTLRAEVDALGQVTAEPEAALAMIDRRGNAKRVTLGADKAYYVTQYVYDLRERSITLHIAIDRHLSKTGKWRKTAIDARTTRHVGYDISQCCRKRIEEVFGWIKSSAGFAKIKLRGRARVDAAFTLALAPYNLIRMPKLLEAEDEHSGQVAYCQGARL
jgi:hypothetical protein